MQEGALSVQGLQQGSDMRELIVDNFAGGGGASTGIEIAVGRPIDFAINHDPEAISMHRANHPQTQHLITSVHNVNPTRLAAGRPVGLGWFSPDCTFHSKARGGKPFRDRDVARRRRGLAGIIPRWAATAAAPRVICLENVEEFSDWGPLLPDGKICPRRRGQLFRKWHRQLENLGYRIDMRELRACDYGAPTTRKRLFIVMRRDGGEIVFPEASHGPWDGADPYRTAAECIDWSVPCPSIFTRDRPLAEATMKRIARGMMRYVINARDPFTVPQGAPFITEHANASNQRNMPAGEPLRTICANVKGGHFALVTAFLAKHYGGNYDGPGSRLSDPMGTITTVDHHALVQAFLVKFYGNEKDGCDLNSPMHTITTKDRFGLVMVQGEPHRIVDIGMRMLTPRELYRAQGFPDGYVIERGVDENGQPIELTKTAQVRMCGNSVSPKAAEALVRANYTQEAA